MKLFKNLIKTILVITICYFGYQTLKTGWNTPRVLVKTEYFEGPVVKHNYSWKWHFYFKDKNTGKVYRVNHHNFRSGISNNIGRLKTKEGDYVKIVRRTYKKTDYSYEYELTYNGIKHDLKISNIE